MDSDSNGLSLTLSVSDELADDEQVDNLTYQLQSEMRDMNLESIERVSNQQAPGGAKGAEAFTLGALAVAVLPAAIPSLIKFLQAWTLRGQSRSVEIEAEYAGRSVRVVLSGGESDPGGLVDVAEELLDLVSRKH